MGGACPWQWAAGGRDGVGAAAGGSRLDSRVGRVRPPAEVPCEAGCGACGQRGFCVRTRGRRVGPERGRRGRGCRRAAWGQGRGPGALEGAGAGGLLGTSKQGRLSSTVLEGPVAQPNSSQMLFCLCACRQHGPVTTSPLGGCGFPRARWRSGEHPKNQAMYQDGPRKCGLSPHF